MIKCMLAKSRAPYCHHRRRSFVLQTCITPQPSAQKRIAQHRRILLQWWRSAPLPCCGRIRRCGAKIKGSGNGGLNSRPDSGSPELPMGRPRPHEHAEAHSVHLPANLSIYSHILGNVSPSKPPLLPPLERRRVPRERAGQRPGLTCSITCSLPASQIGIEVDIHSRDKNQDC